jgi:hypothetical protein
MNGIALPPEAELLNIRTSKNEAVQKYIYLGTTPGSLGQTMLDVRLFFISIF